MPSTLIRDQQTFQPDRSSLTSATCTRTTSKEVEVDLLGRSRPDTALLDDLFRRLASLGGYKQSRGRR